MAPPPGGACALRDLPPPLTNRGRRRELAVPRPRPGSVSKATPGPAAAVGGGRRVVADGATLRRHGAHPHHQGTGGSRRGTGWRRCRPWGGRCGGVGARCGSVLPLPAAGEGVAAGSAAGTFCLPLLRGSEAGGAARGVPMGVAECPGGVLGFPSGLGFPLGAVSSMGPGSVPPGVAGLGGRQGLSIRIGAEQFGGHGSAVLGCCPGFGGRASVKSVFFFFFN